MEDEEVEIIEQPVEEPKKESKKKPKKEPRTMAKGEFYKKLGGK